VKGVEIESLERKVEKRWLSPEMEFVDISLTKDSSLLFHAILSPFYWRILKTTILFEEQKMRVENQKKPLV
jgi:hypothetical protein